MLVVQHAKGCNHGELGAVAGSCLFTEDGQAVAQVHFVGFVDDVGRGRELHLTEVDDAVCSFNDQVNLHGCLREHSLSKDDLSASAKYFFERM